MLILLHFVKATCFPMCDFLCFMYRYTVLGSTDCEMGRTVACDGTFLYMSNTSGRGIVKMGTGLHGTLR